MEQDSKVYSETEYVEEFGEDQASSKSKLPRVSTEELKLILTTLLKRGIHSNQCECPIKREALDTFVNDVMTKVQEVSEYQKMLQRWKFGLQMQTRTHVFTNILMTGIVLGSLLGNPEYLPNLPEVPKDSEGIDLESLFDKLSDELKH